MISVIDQRLVGESGWRYQICQSQQILDQIQPEHLEPSEEL